jgi:hypothetical protein
MTLAISWLHGGGETAGTWLHEGGDWQAIQDSLAATLKDRACALKGRPVPQR